MSGTFVTLCVIAKFFCFFTFSEFSSMAAETCVEKGIARVNAGSRKESVLFASMSDRPGLPCKPTTDESLRSALVDTTWMGTTGAFFRVKMATKFLIKPSASKRVLGHRGNDTSFSIASILSGATLMKKSIVTTTTPKTRFAVVERINNGPNKASLLTQGYRVGAT